LVITKAIIECMGGNIDFESIENEYTRFFFKFDAPHAVGTPCVSVDGFEGSTDDANTTDDFVEDTLDDGPHDRLPPNA